MTILDEAPPAPDTAELLTVPSAPTTTNGHRPKPPPLPARDEHAVRQLKLVRRARASAVVITAIIAAASFALSFSSLSDLAAQTAFPGSIGPFPLAWLWPVIVDGAIVLATVGIVALSPYPEQKRNRIYYWLVLAGGALVSVVGNGWHAWLVTEHLPVWMRWGAVAVACVPPTALLAATHSLAIQWRFNPTPPPDASANVHAAALAVAAERMDKYEAAAAKIHELGYCTREPTAKIAHVLRYLYDHRPAMSLRAIGSQPTVELHHDKVGKIRDAAREVLGPPPTA